MSIKGLAISRSSWFFSFFVPQCPVSVPRSTQSRARVAPEQFAVLHRSDSAQTPMTLRNESSMPSMPRPKMPYLAPEFGISS